MVRFLVRALSLPLTHTRGVRGDGDMFMSPKSSNQPTSSSLNKCTITETRGEAQRRTELLAVYIQRLRGALAPFTADTHAARDPRRVPQRQAAESTSRTTFSCATVRGSSRLDYLVFRLLDSEIERRACVGQVCE